MNNTELLATLQAQFPTAEIVEGKQFVEITVAPSDLFLVAQTLQNDPALEFNYLFNLTGIDLDGKLGVVYHLESYALRHIVVMKSFATDREAAKLPSLVALWLGVELLEREVFEFYGIEFENHPDLRTLFLPDDWQGYPLRKDYYDPVNIVER